MFFTSLVKPFSAIVFLAKKKSRFVPLYTIETRFLFFFLSFLLLFFSLSVSHPSSRLFRIFSDNSHFVIAKLSQCIFGIARRSHACKTPSCDGCPTKLCNFRAEREACLLSSPSPRSLSQRFPSVATVSIEVIERDCELINSGIKKSCSLSFLFSPATISS